jgi:hypothetical protein
MENTDCERTVRLDRRDYLVGTEFVIATHDFSPREGKDHDKGVYGAADLVTPPLAAWSMYEMSDGWE